MGRLVFFLVGVADEHAAQADKGQLAVRFRVLDLSDVSVCETNRGT